MIQTQFNHELLSLKDKLYYYALSLTSDSDWANDLLQETMLKALANRNKFRPNSNFKAWIYTIMRNTFINDYRKNVKARKMFCDSDDDIHLAFSNDKVYPAPDALYSTREIHRNINALKDAYRIPFTMFIEGYKYKEISEKLDLPLGTIKSRIFFSRKMLEKSLQEYSNS